jgi:hypothetical protein
VQSSSNSLPAIGFMTGRPLSCTQPSRTPCRFRTLPSGSPLRWVVLMLQSRITQRTIGGPGTGAVSPGRQAGCQWADRA